MRDAKIKQPFREHLDYAADVVSRWSAWKRNIFGGTYQPSYEEKQMLTAFLTELGVDPEHATRREMHEAWERAAAASDDLPSDQEVAWFLGRNLNTFISVEPDPDEYVPENNLESLALSLRSRGISALHFDTYEALRDAVQTVLEENWVDFRLNIKGLPDWVDAVTNLLLEQRYW